MQHLGITWAAVMAALLVGQPALSAERWAEVPLPAQPHDAVLQTVVAGEGAAWAFGISDVPQEPGLQTLAFRRDEQGWEQVPAPAIGRTNAAAVISRDDAWVVGDGTSMHWNGAEWRQIPIVAPPDLDTQLLGVTSFGPDDVWAVGIMPGLGEAEGHNTVQRWNGEAWAQAPAPRTGMTFGIDGTSADDVWVVGTKTIGDEQHSTDVGIAVRWDGRQWREAPPLTLPDQHVQLRGVRAVAPDDVWAVGYRESPANRIKKPFAAHWDGTGWSAVPTPEENCDLTDLVQTVDGLFAIGSYCVLRYDGDAWQPVPLPSRLGGKQVALTGGAMLDDGRLLMGGFTGQAGGTRSTPFAATYGD
ncbi:hypothetical protein SAMN02982929_06159 [Saccharopolyspora kobensis]|uniref:Uncharacterized protein n=1 Tax=Saccharopolyspora kobensis TaxID=146035 RepID=A0A1H6EDG8_9PSEU|nr:hypothetical protein [Saccharopolyspora kobensis]SEG95301.1 hypothetical protein SAMN02982929_06159 [Saccharopolyspora kobensis]SFD57769.1 hypothetical protein SAMN05216506_105127 [Saccharopolyspora kobensis]